MMRVPGRTLAVWGACAASVVAVPAFVTADHDWDGYHWARQTNPVTLTLGDNTSGAWQLPDATTASDGPVAYTYIDAAAIDWSNPPEIYGQAIDALVTNGLTNPKTCKPIAGRIEVCNSNYGFNGWLGVAQIWVSGTHIQQAIVKLNDSYFNTSTYNSPAWRQFVMCQEVGHTFGLNHQDEAFENLNLGSCMDYTSDPSRNDGVGNNLHPNEHDFAELEEMYTHLDAPSGGGGGGGGGGRGRGGAPAEPEAGEWGRLVRASHGGAVYEADHGLGNRVITFVLWAN